VRSSIDRTRRFDPPFACEGDPVFARIRRTPHLIHLVRRLLDLLGLDPASICRSCAHLQNRLIGLLDCIGFRCLFVLFAVKTRSKKPKLSGFDLFRQTRTKKRLQFDELAIGNYIKSDRNRTGPEEDDEMSEKTMKIENVRLKKKSHAIRSLFNLSAVK
jgi:hypothetical protein